MQNFDYLSLKSLHIIFVVTWYAGLFYIPRLFIYHTEALLKGEPSRSILSEQFKKMTRLLWFVITWPSAILTFIFGTSLILMQPQYLLQGFMQIKIGFVVGLYAYHLGCHRIYKLLQKEVVKYSSNQLRIWNEIPTLTLIAIVFLIVKKNEISWVWGILVIILIAVLLMISIRIYKRLRTRI